MLEAAAKTHNHLWYEVCKYLVEPSSLYYKHITIVIYDSSTVNKFEASVTDDARFIIYDCLMFIVQATGGYSQSISRIIFSELFVKKNFEILYSKTL